MKVDKANFSHWGYLLLFALNVLVALVLRPLRARRGPQRVIFYGHRLNGNLLAIHRYLRQFPQAGVEVAFLTMDPIYQRELNDQGEFCLLATSPRCIEWLATADAVISGHGLHSMLPMLYLSDMKFFDVWHGIPYKGFDADDFRVQHRYDEAWVSSPLLRQIYVERFGFPDGMVKTTGYARTDRLVRRVEDPAEIRRQLGLDPYGVETLVLFAPTWKQDSRNRSLFPFGVDEKKFLGSLSQLGERLDAKFLVRAHLNSGAIVDTGLDRIVHVPFARYPDTEQVLLISDMLVCDWSSIAFDYLLLDRPTIFLDVEPPFAKGLTLDASYRFGAIAKSLEGLLLLLERYLVAPDGYLDEYAARCEHVKSLVYGEYADGLAAERCVGRLHEHLRKVRPRR